MASRLEALPSELLHQILSHLHLKDVENIYTLKSLRDRGPNLVGRKCQERFRCLTIALRKTRPDPYGEVAEYVWPFDALEVFKRYLKAAKHIRFLDLSDEMDPAYWGLELQYDPLRQRSDDPDLPFMTQKVRRWAFRHFFAPELVRHAPSLLDNSAFRQRLAKWASTLPDPSSQGSNPISCTPWWSNGNPHSALSGAKLLLAVLLNVRTLALPFNEHLITDSDFFWDVMRGRTRKRVPGNQYEPPLHRITTLKLLVTHRNDYRAFFETLDATTRTHMPNLRTVIIGGPVYTYWAAPPHHAGFSEVTCLGFHNSPVMDDLLHELFDLYSGVRAVVFERSIQHYE